jgi:hypothetical protein
MSLSNQIFNLRQLRGHFSIRHMKNTTLSLALVLSSITPLHLSAGPNLTHREENKNSIYYTFSSGMKGGVTEAVIDTNTGKILQQNTLIESPLFCKPHKIKLSECRNYLLATSQHEGLYNLALVDLRTNKARLLSVPRKPDDIAAWGDKFIIGADEQMCYILNATTGKITRRWNGKHNLYPEGRRIEYVTTTSDGTAWTSWQKDSPSGRRKGSRIVAIDIASGRTISDMHLPRALPHLHLADFKEQGPNPEIIIPSPKTNTMLLSMDLYGGIALADLNAMREGRWQNLTYHNASQIGKWGTAFPDRAILYPVKNNDFALIANAGKEGGINWVDMRKRQIVQTLQTPPGLETPVIVANGRHLVAPALGKTKYRFFGDLQETRHPLSELYVFDVTPGENPRLSLRTIPLPTKAYRAAPVAPHKNDLVLLVAGNKGARELITLRSTTGTIIDRAQSVGKIERITY